MKIRTQKYYHIYSESLDTIIDVYDKIKHINDKYPFDEEKINYFYVDLQTTYSLALNIVREKVNFLLANILETMCYNDNIKFYDGYSFKLFEKYNSAGFECVVDYGVNNYSITAPLENSITDVFALVHEISHFYKFENIIKKEKITYELLSEVIPVYSELLTYEYLVEKYGNRSSFYNMILERFACNRMYSDKQLGEKICDRINTEQFKYNLAYLIALYLYDRHKIDPDATEVDIYNYASNLGKTNFNKLMSILKVPIRIEHDEIYFPKNGLEELLKSYESNLSSFVDNYNKAVEREEKYIAKKVLKK